MLDHIQSDPWRMQVAMLAIRYTPPDEEIEIRSLAKSEAATRMNELRGMKSDMQIIDALRGKVMTSQEISNAIGMSKTSVNRKLRGLLAQGEVEYVVWNASKERLWKLA